MRISDWSSDVCSSDLADDVAADLVGRAHEAVAAARPLADYRRASGAPRGLADDRRTVADARACAARHARGAGLHPGAALSAAFRPGGAALPADRRRAPGETGTASCRESVCQYV